MTVQTLNIKRTKSVSALLIEGKRLFWKYGITKVTVDEICREAGVSKMTFYRSFENKYELARIILVDFANKSYDTFYELFTSDAPFPKIIEEFLELKRKQATAISMEFVKDMYQTNDFTAGLRSVLEESQQNLMAVVYKSFDKAREEGWINEHMSTAFIMYMFDKFGNLGEDKALFQMFNTSEEMTVTLTNFLFHGFMKTDTKVNE